MSGFARATRAVFLDRDGVLNEAVVAEGRPHPPQTIGEFIIAPDAPRALIRLKAAAFFLVVVSNQPDIARGSANESIVREMNDRLVAALPIDVVEICPHDDRDACDCRKPKPGMLLRAASKFGIDLAKSFMVGDRWRDVEAGNRAGCKTVLIGDGYGEAFLSHPRARADSLSEAASWIIEQSHSDPG